MFFTVLGYLSLLWEW